MKERTINDLTDSRTLTIDQAVYLWMAVETKNNILVGGKPSSGKSDTLNALSVFIAPDDKTIVSHDPQNRLVKNRPWMNKPNGNSLGPQQIMKRPENIIADEITPKNSKILFQAMATGHSIYATVEGRSPHSIIKRLLSSPYKISPTYLDSLDCLAHQEKTTRGNKVYRFVDHIIEPNIKHSGHLDSSQSNVLTQQDTLENRVDDLNVLKKYRNINGLSKQNIKSEIQRRKNVLQYIQHKKFGILKNIQIVHSYIENPTLTLKRISSDSF